jgi:hypothetical protein
MTTPSNVCGISIDRFTQATTAAGAAKTLNAELNNNQIILLDTVGGSVVTLPSATGSGSKFRFVVSVLATSPNHVVKVGNTTDVMQGSVSIGGAGALAAAANPAFFSGATNDTITLNRTTTGGVSLGESFEVLDLASGVWQVTGQLAATGTPATPFSATV